MIPRYLFLSFCSVILTIIAQFSFLWALFVNKDGRLPRWLSWFNPPDTAAWGDQAFWQNEVPAGGWYQLILWYWRSVLWLRRNGAPNFVNATSAAGYNLKPNTGSPLIGAGSHANAPTNDLTGATFGNPPDIGAYTH